MCVYPTMVIHIIYSTDEIKIDAADEPGLARIIAFSDWGILRGMESFSQLVYSVSLSSDKIAVR